MADTTPEPINDLYSRRILKLAADVQRTERLDDPDATVTKTSPLCGSRVTVDIKLDGDEISDFAHEVKACALGQTSSSVMARNAVGSSVDEIRNVADTMRKMLKEGGPAPSGRWSDLEVLEPVRDYKSRHASVMLTFDAVLKAIEEIKDARPASDQAGAE
jgi:NifU-like protein involved in Fe-S cluster formation